MRKRRCAAMLGHRGCNDDAAHNGLIRATKSQSSRRNVLDVDADAVPAQRVRRVDRRDGHLDQAHDRQEGDGEPGVSARGAPSSNSAMRQQSSIVAPHGGSLTASTIARPGILKGSATLGSRATTAPELIKGTTSFTTGAGTRLRF